MVESNFFLDPSPPEDSAGARASTASSESPGVAPAAPDAPRSGDTPSNAEVTTDGGDEDEKSVPAVAETEASVSDSASPVSSGASAAAVEADCTADDDGPDDADANVVHRTPGDDAEAGDSCGEGGLRDEADPAMQE